MSLLHPKQFGFLHKPDDAQSDLEQEPSFWDQPHTTRNFSGVERRVRVVPGKEPSPQLPGLEGH